MERCAELGFNLTNTPGVDEIRPKAMGMKGVEVDFDKIQIERKPTEAMPKSKSKRIDLGVVADDSKTQLISTKGGDGREDAGDFIELDAGDDQGFEALGYNHKLRRKLRRAVEAADIKKELLVRQQALEHCLAKNIEPPIELQTPHKPVSVRGQRVLEDGRLETAKQERVRMRMELAEYNKAARVLRKQAKQAAIEAGLRKFAELTGAVSHIANAVSHAEQTAAIFGDESSALSSDGQIEPAEDINRKRARDTGSDGSAEMESTKKRYRQERVAS